MKHIYTILISIVLLSISFSGFSQIDGTFSNATTTFPANGFTVVNDALNVWVVGTATHNGAPNSAYITNDGGITNAYTNNNSEVSHFYFDYTFPAGETIITLDFDWRCEGEELFGTTPMDYMKVYLVPTTTTPVANTLLASGQIGTIYQLQSTWQNESITIDGANAGTTQRIVFTWRNDYAGGTNPPAAVDNIVITTIAPADMAYASSSVTQNNTSNVNVGATDAEIIGIEIVTTGNANAIDVSLFTFNVTGTDNPATNITNATLWSTKTSGTFATTTQVGDVEVGPTGTFTVDATETGMPFTLSSGTNYFWLTYTIAGGATVGEVVDAQCTSITVDGSVETPTNNPPAGNREIELNLVYCDPNPSSVDNSGITRVVFGSIDNPTGVEAGNYGDYSAMTNSIAQGTLATVNITYETGYTYVTKIWVDYNNDGDFDDVGEEVYSGTSTNSNPTTLVATFTVDAAASAGNHRMRIGGADTGPPTPCYTGSFGSYEDYTINITALSDMAYSSSTVTQNNTGSVSPSSTDAEIIGIEIVTTGSENAIDISSFSFNVTGSDNPATNLTNATLWWSPTSTFATTTQVGDVEIGPTGSFDVDATETGMPFTLSTGTNYFWLTYTIEAGATLGDFVDAQCTSITVDGTDYTPTNNPPAGNRVIDITYCTPSFTNITDEWITNVTFNTIDNTTGQDGATSYGDYTGLSTDVAQGSTYQISVTFNSIWTQDIFVWFDWNHNGDFSDAGEEYQICDNLSAPATHTLDITIPNDSYIGSTRMRVITYEPDDPNPCTNTSQLGETEDYSINITGSDMSFVSCTTTQNNTLDLLAGSTNEEIMGIQIVTDGSLNAINASLFTFTTTGCDAAATDLTDATLWYTGSTNTFAPGTQVGDIEINPNGTFTFDNTETNMPYTLAPGTNYFWLTYTINGIATSGDIVDVTCESITINGNPETPIETAPTGDRLITDCIVGRGKEAIALPFTDLNATNCGELNSVTSSNASNICGSSNYYNGKDYIYIFTPTLSGNITIDLSTTGSFTGMVLYDGCPTDGGTCVNFEQSTGGNESMCVTVTSGVEYYLIIDSYPSPDCNNYEITISAPTGSNIGFTCATPYVIGSLPFSINGLHTACSGDDYTNATSGTCTSTYASGEDYVFEYTATSSECISVTLYNTNEYASVSIYDGCPGAGTTCLGWKHEEAGAAIGTTTLPSAGTYYIVIDTDNSGALNTPFDLNITSFGSGQANDLPCNAEPLGIGSILSGNNECSGGGDTPGNPSCGFTGDFNSVWYSIVAPASGEVKIKTELLSISNTILSLWSGTCDNLIEEFCNDDMADCGSNTYTMSEIHATGLTPGETYFACVDGYGNAVGTFTIIAIDGTDTYTPSFGQDCGLSQAIPVCNSQFTVGNPGYQAVGNVCDFTGDGPNCMISGERGSVWYSIPIAADGNLEFTLVPNDYDAGGATGNETDYDFGVWQFVGPDAVTCAEIADGSSTPIACNFSMYGITGLYDTGDASAPYSPDYDNAFEPSIPVLTGEIYVLVISNYSNSTSGFGIDFGAGSPILYPGTPTSLTWTGGAGNTDWYTPMNWGNCNAYPNENIDIVIPPSSMFQPIISRVDPNDGTNARCKSITINPGASLTINSGFTLEVYGDYNNTGTLSAHVSSTTEFKGASNQNMDGNMTGFSKFGYFNIDKTGGDVTLNNDLAIESDFATANVTSILNSNGLHVSVGGNFTLNSSATYTGAGTTGILEFNGTSAQVFTTGTGATLQLNDVIMDNSSIGLTINDDLSVGTSGILTLTNGIIHTDVNKVIVNNTSSAATPVGRPTTYINGTLRGYIASNTDTYLYPVGVSDRYTIARIFNSNMTPTSYFDVTFLNSYSNTGSLDPAKAIDDGVPYLDIAPEGIWEINPDVQPTGGSYSLELYFDDGEGYDGSGLPLGNGFSNLVDNEFGIVKRSSASGIAEDWSALEGTRDITDGAGRLLHDNYARRNGLSTFSRFAIARKNIVLPIELVNFDAKCNDKEINLSWTTASEINNDFFTIERRENNKFVKVATVKGAGNSNEALSYSFTDKSSTYGVNYYRLKQTDIDGKFTYSNIIKSSCTSSEILDIYHYMENDNLFVIIEASCDDVYTIELLDYSGKSIISQSKNIFGGHNSTVINTNKFAKGLYMLIVKNKNDIYSEKVIID